MHRLRFPPLQMRLPRNEQFRRVVLFLIVELVDQRRPVQLGFPMPYRRAIPCVC